jgi:hypothetical protein
MHLERLAEANPQPSTRELGLHTSLDSRVLPTAELASATAEACSDPAETVAACRGLYPPCIVTPAISRGSSIDAGSPLRGTPLSIAPLRGTQGREASGAQPSFTIF